MAVQLNELRVARRTRRATGEVKFDLGSNGPTQKSTVVSAKTAAGLATDPLTIARRELHACAGELFARSVCSLAGCDRRDTQACGEVMKVEAFDLSERDDFATLLREREHCRTHQ